MGSQRVSNGTDDFERVAAPVREVFARIAAGERQRTADHVLPHEPIAWLRDANFLRLRLPQALGGEGLSLRQIVTLLIELAEADPSVAHSLRIHGAVVEDAIAATATEPGTATHRDAHERRADRVLDLLVAGDLFSGSLSEPGNVQVGASSTAVTARDDGRLVLDGEKYYSTGSVFADWLVVGAAHDDVLQSVLVAANAPGVTHIDDWDGIGQELTGSGTTVFREVEVRAEDIRPYAASVPYTSAYYQLVLLAVLAGIARAAVRDVTVAVHARRRVYVQGTAERTSDDPQIQQVIGEVAAKAWAVERLVLSCAEDVQAAYLATATGTRAEATRASDAADDAVGKAQLVVADLVLELTTQLFDGLGSSGVLRSAGLDRHWRNARVIASHNPLVFKARLVGARELHGTPIWSVRSDAGTAHATGAAAAPVSVTTIAYVPA